MFTFTFKLQLEMKKIFILSLTFLAFVQFSIAQSGAQISFNEDRHDFGTLEEGPSVSHKFNFTNTGTEPLVLTNVKASCGCTTPSWTKEPVLPGENGEILVTYSTARRLGGFNKSITITSNATEPTKVIYIKGTVEAASEDITMPVKQPLMMAPTK